MSAPNNNPKGIVLILSPNASCNALDIAAPVGPATASPTPRYGKPFWSIIFVFIKYSQFPLVGQ